jgi:hypothetical protein
VYHRLYSEAVVSSVASALALVEVGRLREAVEYVQKAAKALYEGAREVFEHVKITVQRLVELFVEAVARVLAWVDEHKAYLFLMAAVAAGIIALSAASNLWGLVEMEKLAHAAVGAPFVAGLADVGKKTAERFKTLRERYERRRVDESLVDGVLKALMRGERPYAAFLKLTESRRDLPPPLVELRKALARVKDEVEKDAAVVAALVLYKTLVKNAEAYGKWAELYKWARSLVEEPEFTVAAGKIREIHETHNELRNAAGKVIEEVNSVLALYSQSDFYKKNPDLLDKLKQLLEVDLGKAEELAGARRIELSKYSDANMGTKAYAAFLSIARGGIYGHAAMLLMSEGALVDILKSTPSTAYRKVDDIAGARGETVDPSRSRRRAKAGGIAGGRGGAVDLPHVEAANWGDKTASVLLRFLIGYGEIDPQFLSGAGEVNLKFRLVVKDSKKDDEKKRVEGGVKKGFQVSRAYGDVEAPVGELWIGDVAYFKIGKEELRRLVEEAKRTAPDLSGIKKIRQTLEWLSTDVSFIGRQILGSTARIWQLRWYLTLFGGGRASGGVASITEEGIKLNIIMHWRREDLDNIIAAEGEELEPLLGRPVKSWRELVDAIDWSWVLERVGKLVDELKPWIGPEKMSDAGREGLVRRILGELELLAHFVETRRGMDDRRWREERTKRLAKAVEALSSGRIKGDQANELAKLIISYAESRDKRTKNRIDKLAEELAGVFKEDVKRVKGEVWGIVDFILSDMHRLARDCARDAVVRKFVAPALELIMLDKALNNEFDREKALLLFGEMYATAIAGDGTVGRKLVELAVGGELGGGAALLRLATLLLLNQLLPDERKFGIRTYVVRDRYYYIVAYGEDVARFTRLLAVSAPSASGEYLSPKFDQFVEAAKVEVRFGNIRLTDKGHVAADLTISEGGADIRYNVYLREHDVSLKFQSTDRGRVELAALLLKLAGVGAEVKKKREGKREVWYVVATTDKLAAGRKELRDTLAEIVRTAVENGWVEAGKAEGWLEKLVRGRVLMEGWPKYGVRLTGSGALEVRFGSTDPDSIKREAQRLREMGLEEGKHFTVKMPEEGRNGYFSVLKEGLAHAAWLSVHGSGEQQRLAAEFVEYILRRAWEAGKKVYEKAQKVVDEGKARGSLKLEGFEKRVEVGGREHVVRVIDGGAELEESQRGKKLLRIRITAEVDGVMRDYVMTYSRFGADNEAMGFATARADAPGGRETDAERFSALIKALTGKEPRIRRRSDGTIEIVCGREHLEGFKRFAELAEGIAKWLEETGRRA